jgi:uncharacterized protein (DUF1800 family)
MAIQRETTRGTRVDAGLAEIAHLLRRAGFGATLQELRAFARKGYEATVEELLNPPPPTPDEALLVDRYFPASTAAHEWAMAWPHWAWPIVTTRHPLREKLALFWHGLFATGFKLGIHGVAQMAQINLFREHGFDRFADLLVRVSEDPAMLVWLDNDSNTKDAPNENYGRELLELFSMGVGNYSEADVKAVSRAFTGWTIRPSLPAFLHGPHALQFVYRAQDHDHDVKVFLGESGNFNGQDVVRIIARQPATARFICSRLYQFFVADELDEAAVERLTGPFRDTDGDIRSVLRALFMSSSFRSSAVRFRKVKSPIELVFGLARLTERWPLPDHRLLQLVDDVSLMGQTPLNPPNVGGWPNGVGWLNGSCMLERINVASRMIADPGADGVQRVLEEIEAHSDASPEGRLEACLLALGALEVTESSREILLECARQANLAEEGETSHSVLRLLKFIAASPCFQYC